MNVVMIVASYCLEVQFQRYASVLTSRQHSVVTILDTKRKIKSEQQKK
jgi:hypothetical protein